MRAGADLFAEPVKLRWGIAVGAAVVAVAVIGWNWPQEPPMTVEEEDAFEREHQVPVNAGGSVVVAAWGTALVILFVAIAFAGLLLSYFYLRLEIGAELHRDDLAATFGQRHRGLPSPGADLQQPAARPDPGQLRHVVKQRRRVARPGPVVQLGGLVEGRSQPLAIGWWHPSSVPQPSPSAVSGAGAVVDHPEHPPRGRARRCWPGSPPTTSSSSASAPSWPASRPHAS
jgi:hypothetical protein